MSQHEPRHEYVGTGERCRLCGFTSNHLVHVSEPDSSDTAPAWFVHDVAIYNLAVEQYTITVDGEKVISTACPEAIRKHYSKLLQHGYANGWL